MTDVLSILPLTLILRRLAEDKLRGGVKANIDHLVNIHRAPTKMVVLLPDRHTMSGRLHCMAHSLA